MRMRKCNVEWSFGARLHYLCSLGYIADKIFDTLGDLVESPLQSINSEHSYQRANRCTAIEDAETHECGLNM